MRRVRFYVAMSLDGYIAGPQGEFDWLPQDPAIDFAAFLREVDTVLMGRKTYEVVRDLGPEGALPGKAVYVFTRTLSPADISGADAGSTDAGDGAFAASITVVSEDAAGVVAALKRQPGQDIWLMGGGILFRALLDARLVDSLEVGVIPILLGRGIPLLPQGDGPVRLRLTGSQITPGGIALLSYALAYDAPPSA